MIKNIFLDRDGIINEVVMKNNVIGSPRIIEEFKIKKDFIHFASEIVKYDFNVFVVSNQPDISRSLIDMALLEKIDIEIQKLLPVKEIMYCIHDDSDNCSCRKPKPGMINTLLDKYHLKKDESCIIGDSFKDIQAGQSAGIMTVFLETDYNKSQEVKPDYRISELNDLFHQNPDILDFKDNRRGHK